jgi:hypothetical protein
MTTSPSKEDLDAYRERLGAAYAALDAAGASVDLARDDVEEARDAASTAFGTPEATSIFSDAISDCTLAARAIADAVDALPPLDEDDGKEEGGANS